MDRTTFRKMYETDIYNQAGVQGYAYVPHGISVAVSDPRKMDVPGTNPEQLLGLALSTCLNATLQAIEAEQGLEHQASVHVHVTMGKSNTGLEFLVEALVRIPNVSSEQAQKMLQLAEKRCPVSKLLSGSANYSVLLVDEDSLS
ncbi:OsmC family protein [Bombilactobacillus folatiphilus]|uniref:OsmC family protein n=1 Tax=Bombilactobacillus folatiphilus TaxID=2923362 RepID=A0ABY4P7Y5_9LACO|nr:OsmC family protein [Bombilactobacillus folatiphilus]UQS81752.1 OsmC family protein [Bombilactobacillus folatiphilus]